MVQQHLTLWNVSEQHQFCHNLDGKVLNFSPAAAKMQCGLPSIWGVRSYGLTLQHHSLDLYGGHDMVLQHLTLWNVSEQHQFCPGMDGNKC